MLMKRTKCKYRTECSVREVSCTLVLSLRRSIEVANSAETFEEVLHRSRGFDNPSLIEYLTEKLGISESNPPSLMRSLQM